MTLHPMALMPPLDLVYQFASDYRMSDDALFELARVLCKQQPQSIIETGPGLSTCVILKYLEHQPACQFVSINHDSDWDEKIRKFLMAYDLDPWPYIETYELQANGWYTLLPERYFATDLLILDGPCSSEARACPEAMELYRSVCDNWTTIIVDDFHRPAEQRLLSELGYLRPTVIQDTLYPTRLTAIAGRLLSLATLA